MAVLKEIKNRIQAVQNTKKITKTMEMISTAKAKKASDQLRHTKEYFKKFYEIATSLLPLNPGHRLLQERETKKLVGILAVSANRSLCGGFNTSVIKLVHDRRKEWEKKNVGVEIHLFGKKITSSFRSSGNTYAHSYPGIDDLPVISSIYTIVNSFINSFVEGRIDVFEVISTRYNSATSQHPCITQILPFSGPNNAENMDNPHLSIYRFEPSSKQILASIIPETIRILLYQLLIESYTSEQIARRIAMKNATENATDILKDLNKLSNRVRQAKITQEIAEIVGGAGAVQA